MVELYLWGEAERYQNYWRAVELAGGELRFGGDPVGCAGLLLPGGGDMEPWRYGQKLTASRSLEPRRDEAELELLAMFVEAKKPVLGICRGLQVMNVFFGGTLVQHLEGHSAVEGVDRLHRVRTVPSRLWDNDGESRIVNSAHHQAIDRLGAGLQAIQWAPDGVIEAIEHRTLPVWGVQWHPERMRGYTVELFRKFLLQCRKQVFPKNHKENR